MKTFKKLFSVSAIVALLGTLIPTYALAANSLDDNPEFPEAYAYAYNNGITTQTEDNADMSGKLTRIAMAKMIAKYAKNVLKLEADTTAECTFVDVTAALDAQYDNGVTEACQYGLMGQNMPENKFRPNDLVTRAEFGTTLSRALHRAEGTTVEEGTPYYENHLNYLKDEGIMKDISNPSMNEVRGYVMIMMKRADKTYVPAEGCSAMEIIQCLTAEDFDACKAACSAENPEEEVLPGYATITTKAESAQTVALNAVDKKIGTVTLKAGENDTTVTALEITKGGLGARADVATISLMKNGEYVTNAATLNANNVAKLRFRPNLTLKANSSSTFDVVVSMGGGSAGGTHDFSVTAATVSNGTFGGVPAKLGSLTTTNYSVATLTGDIAATTSADAGDENTEITTITLKPGADATVDSITLSSENNNDSLTTVIANAKAYIDDEVVGNVTVNDETIVIAGLNKSITKGKSVDVVLKADVVFAGDNNTAFTFTIEENRIVATENNTKERMYVPEDAGTFTITNGVGLTLKNNVKKVQKVVVDTEDVVLMDMDIESSANVDVLDYTLVFDNYNTQPVANLEDIRVSVDGDEFDLPAKLFDKNSDDTVDNVQINLADTQLNAFTIDAGKKANVKVLATVKAGGPSNYKVTLYVHKIKNTDTNNNIGVKYDSTDLSKKLKSEAGHETQVTDGSLNVTKKSTAGSTIKIGEATDVLAFTVKSKSEDATLRTLTINTPFAKKADANELKSDVIDEITLIQGSNKKTLDSDDLKLMATCTSGTKVEYVEYSLACPATYTKADDGDVAFFLSGTFTSLATSLKEDSATEFTVQLKVASDVSVSKLGSKVSLNLPVNGLVAKGKTSDNTVKNATPAEGKEYQIATTRPAIELAQDGKFITVTVNNESDYNIQLTGLTLNVLSERGGTNNTQLLPSDTPWQVREDSTDGTLLTNTEITPAGKIPGTPSWTFNATHEPTIAEGESAVFVIEMNSEVNIATSDYTTTAKSFGFKYWDEDANGGLGDWGTIITETY